MLNKIKQEITSRNPKPFLTTSYRSLRTAHNDWCVVSLVEVTDRVFESVTRQGTQHPAGCCSIQCSGSTFCSNTQSTRTINSHTQTNMSHYSAQFQLTSREQQHKEKGIKSRKTKLKSLTEIFICLYFLQDVLFM